MFAKELAAAGVYASTIGLEAPYQLGKVERHGAIWKVTAAKVIEQKGIVGLHNMMNLATVVNSVVNERNRTVGFSPAQWALARTPRYGTGDNGDDEQF